MTKELFIDTDCIAAFLWVEEQSILSQLYGGNIIIPKQVYNELSYPGTPHLKQRVDNLVQAGEAAAISLAKINDGVLASNNLRDISQYVAEYSLKHITTGDIMVEVYNKGIITESQGNAIWASMLLKRRKIGASSFSDYLQQNNTIL